MQRTRLDGRLKKKIIVLAIASILIIGLGILFDQLTKVYFRKQGEGYGVSVIGKFLRFSVVFNSGAAYGSLGDKPWAQTFFLILTIIALIGFTLFLAYVIYKCAFKRRYVLLISISMIISGIIGNFIDRRAFGEVTDFIRITVFGADIFGVFNIADVLLSIGVVLVLIHFLFLDESALFKKKAKKDVGNETDANL